MKFDPKIHHRRSIRLPEYDYSQPGAYFVTIVTQGREPLFGEIRDERMALNQFGEIVRQAWFDLPRHYPHLELGTFGIMPNHVHGIMDLNEGGGGSLAENNDLQRVSNPNNAPRRNLPKTRPYNEMSRHPLSEIIRAFKSFSARRINAIRRTQGIPVWQRNYYEHIIRDDEDHKRIRLYIESNPLNWVDDDENPERR